MAEDMWRLWFTKLLLIGAILVALHTDVRAEDAQSLNEEIAAPRIERDVQGVTTVLLVSARPGKSVPPVGLLTKTARTFVQDGASTEFATQVVGTTLDNGRLYARILSTSSRVFYDKEPSPDPPSPYVVYPSRAPEDDWRFRVALDNAPIKAIKEIDTPREDQNEESTSNSEKLEVPERTSLRLDELSRENDIFNKKELNTETQRFKPAKVRPADNLPTYTVKHEYVTSSFDAFQDDQPKSFRPRVPKIFKPQTKAPPPRKLDLKPLATVTYHGFADFTTIVGDTVIIFSPSTSPAPAGRPATTIKGDATLRPDDGVAVVKIRPTNVLSGHEQTEQPTPGNQDQSNGYRETGDQLLDAINRGNIQPSVTDEVEETHTTSTEPLLLIPDVETGSLKPTGLLKVIDSTTAQEGTTTHYKSLIYGTYIGTNYAQIIHTSSNVYFFPDEATASYGTEDTTVDYGTTATDDDEGEQETTVEMTTGTTPRMITTTEETPAEMNELTTPFRDTTDSVLTTLKDILESARRVLGTTESDIVTLDDEIPNDIVPGDPQGRSIKGGSPKNDLGHLGNKGHGFPTTQVEPKVTLATRLLPSTVYKTFTYFTTFFIPDGNDHTTTSIKSREVVSSDVTYLTELILPSATATPILPTAVTEPMTTQKAPVVINEPEEEQTTKQDEEIELIFKTLYTTYTYLTTFFQENTSSVSSREVVETNVITQTVGPNGVSAVVAGLFETDESVLIAPTKMSESILPSATPEQTTEEVSQGTEKNPTTVEVTTEGILTTFQEQDTTFNQNIPTEPGTTTDEFEDSSSITEIEPSPTPAIPTQALKEQIKTYYTTYTYFTTIFVDDETEIETRTEVFKNVVTETIQPTAVVPVTEQTVPPTTPKSEPAEKPPVPPEILAYLEALQRQKSQEEALSLAKKVQEEAASNEEEDINVTEGKTEPTTDFPTTWEDRITTENNFRDFQVNAQVTPNPPVDGEILGSMITDVVSSSSSGGGTVLDIMDKRNAVPEDQELSESNHHDVEPAPTLLLQTSYTTFTYFTTMYKGDESNVASRLETVTNVVTETIRPTAVAAAETSTLPVTYFTTFTYWTTFYKGGDTVTTSREETVSNVVTPGVSPTPTIELGVVMTYRPSSSMIDESPIEGKESKVTADNEVTPSNTIAVDKPPTSKTEATTPGITTIPSELAVVDASTISPDPTTFYTTYTYFTTSYIGNETILNSRLETVTSVSISDVATQQATGRAIGGPVYPAVQTLKTEDKPVTPSKVSEAPKTGLISTVRSSQVHEGTTTHYMTDVYGTYIDGLYAQVVESSTRLETPPLPSSSVVTPVLPTGVLSLNEGSIVDADEVTTVYFTTKQIGTLLDGLYAKVIESTSSTKIDEEKKASIPPTQGHRTGLVRLIQGNIENNGTTTYYQSKVIGTSIDGRYAQIIESTSSFLSSSPTANIAPTSTLPPTHTTGVPEVSPSPAVIQSSLSEDPTTESPDQEDNSEENEEDDEDGEEDEDDQSSKKKSRLTFSTRKRTFTPVIRPFASRNRPTFNPKRKGAQGATTITRTDITPTITATLAGKGNRFASSRGRVSSPIGPYSSTLAPSGSRRFSGRRGSPSTSSSYSSSVSGSTRGRQQSRISPSSVFQGNRRGPTSIRGSSARAASRGSSSAFPGASSRFRAGIRPSSTLLRGQPTIRHDDQENDANEFTTTTLFTEETPYTEDIEDGETVTTPLQTTTESSRRSTNPLLRFRRPLNLNSSGRSGTTPRPTTTTRRNGNLSRASSPTLPRVTSTRGAGRTNIPISTRPRQGNTGLFPPRGLLGRKPELPAEDQIDPNEDFDGEDEENFEDDAVEEITDNDYEGSEHEDRTTTTSVNRRSGKSIRPNVQIRPFGFGSRTRRVRRQASQLRSLTNRFRRPNQSSPPKSEDKADVSETVSSKEDSAKSAAKPVSRYNNRARSLTTSRPSSKSSNSPEKTSAESVEQSKARPRTKQNGERSSSRIKPSPASGNGRQFTLREKDSSSTSRSGYKRPSSSGSRSNSRSSPKSSESNRVRPPRLRSSQSESPSNSRRVPPSRSSSSRSNRNGSSRRGSTQRLRGSHEEIRESPTIYPDFDGTITVTHYVPTEVTIPVVNNGITENRNIITAQPSTEVLGPSQYSTVTGGDGRPLIVIVSEVTGTNLQGQAEVTRFLLHETPTTRISHTLTTLGGRRASQSVIVPTTVYSVENVVSTIQPSIPGNAPLANILLSQLLLGQLGQPNPLLQPQGTPTTQYNTRTTSYVTTITKHQSTVIPLTFRGKEILTTLVDSSTNVVTATEFVTDTVVVTPTAALPAANLNSLLLLLQQPQAQAKNSNPLLDPLFAAAPFTQSNTLPGEVERRHQPADSDYKQNSYEYVEEEEEEEVKAYHKPSKSRNGRVRNDKKEDHSNAAKGESSVVTLYVSGRRPGEFSTVLSTVKIGESASASRRRRDSGDEVVEVRPSIPPSLHAGPEAVTTLAGSEDSSDTHAPTQSLESVVDDYHDDYIEHRDKDIEEETDGGIIGDWLPNKISTTERPLADDNDEYNEEIPRKRVRIRVPVVRRNGRQHKLTVVRRRPLTPRTQDVPLTTASHTPRRIVVTRVRTLGLANSIHGSDSQDPENDEPEYSQQNNFRPGIGRHKVTITRRRKIQPTPAITSTTANRVRITRKKLIAVRPVQPTPSFTIITTGFFTAPPSEVEEEYSDGNEEEEAVPEVSTTFTPNLEEMPNVVDNKPEEVEDESFMPDEVPPEVSETTTEQSPVIITDNFFFPPSGDEEEEEYEDDYVETTTSRNVMEPLTPKSEEESPVTKSSSDEENNVVEIKHETTTIESDDGEITTIKTTEVVLPETAPDKESTTEVNVSKEETLEDVTTTTVQQEEESTSDADEDIATESEDMQTTVQEDASTTNNPQVQEETTTKESEHSTNSLETIMTAEEPTTVNIPEEEPETTTVPEKGTTITTVEHPSSTTTESSKTNVTDVSKEIDKVNDEEVEITTLTSEVDDEVSKSLDEESQRSLEEEEPMKSSEETDSEDDMESSKVTTETSQENALTVQPIQPDVNPVPPPVISIQSPVIEPSFTSVLPLDTSSYSDETDIPSVIPLDIESSSITPIHETVSTPITEVTTIASPTPEDIEAGLADDLYLSLSRPDFPEILPSKPIADDSETKFTPNLALEPSTSVYYTETVVTSTRLRTYTYVVTQLNGLETKVTSSTTVRPRVTTLTLTVPVTVTVTPTVESSANSVSSVYNPVPVVGESEARDEEGRRFNLATRVMSNGVEVIVAGPTPALRWENSIPQPTLTLSDAVVMMLPQDKPNEFVTKTCTTTFTYLSTITKDGTTTVSTEQQVVANTATEERHRKAGSETAAVTLEASPTLRTEVFKTTYTYLTLNTDHPNVNDALESSTKVITNTVTAPQHYLDMILEPSEAPRPETNTYFSTRVLEKTFMEDGRTRVETASDTVTQLIVTESAPPPRPTSVTTTLTALDNTEGTMTDVMKTYYITYTYYNTFLEKGSTVVRTNVATSTDVVLEKVPVKKTTTKTAPVNPTPEPIQIFATKTYLTTFTYFTTLLQAGPDGETSTTVSSRSHIVENVVTESIAPSLLDAGYMNALLTTAHHSDPVKNVVTGSTIIFFDEEDQIDPTTTAKAPEATTLIESEKEQTISPSFISATSAETSSAISGSNSKPVEQVNQDNKESTVVSDEPSQNKRPSQNGGDLQVSNLLSLGSLGINSLSALGPVITAMAGLLQGKTSATRRNDTVSSSDVQEVTTQRSPIYIPVAEFADGDIETAESQNIGSHLANLNHNYIADSRHKVAASLADGIPISPGEVITANSDVIIGKPGKMAPRPPQTFLNNEEHIGMKPPPLPVPNIPVHPVLEVLEDNHEDNKPQQSLSQVQIYPAHQVYEEHLKIPVPSPLDTKQPQKLHPVQSIPKNVENGPPKRIGSKQGILENDPLLKPPNRPNVEQYANPDPEWSPEKYRRPWSAKDPLTPPLPPPRFDQKIHTARTPDDKPWPVSSTEEKRHPWAQKDPLLPDASVAIQSSESKPIPSEPIVHQVPHVIDRSTGQPLLVNIQPSQVANVVIPQGGTQALIFGDTNEPHISGQYFDDPSPYPEPEVGLGFVGIQSVEDLPQFSSAKDPADYMVPPSPPASFKPLSDKSGSSNRQTAIPLSPVRFDFTRPQDKLEAPLGRPDKQPSDVHFIKRPDGSGGQGHVHTEILVHHRPESVNIRPQTLPHPSVHSHVHPGHHLPTRGQFKGQKPNDPNIPPRRTEVSGSDVPHRYIFLGKPDSGNEVGLNTNWKSDKKPPRIVLTNRPRPRPPLRPTTGHSIDRPIYIERPIHSVRKPVYSGPQRLPPKTSNTFVLQHRPLSNPPSHHEPPRISTSIPVDIVKEVATDRPILFGHPLQIELHDRPSHFHQEKKNPDIPQRESQTERNEEHIPTGAIEYHNPSNPKIKPEDTKYYSQVSTTKPHVQNFGQVIPLMEEQPDIWHSNTQTEKPLLDSAISASEHVKYEDEFKEQIHDTVPETNYKQDTEMNKNTRNSSSSANVNNSYGSVVTLNTVVGKPLEVEQGTNYGQKEKKPAWLNQGVPFSPSNDASNIKNIPYGSDFYNTKPYDLPPMQGKPFGVYNGQVDLSTLYGHKPKDSRPEYEIVQGVPTSYYGDKKPSFVHKNPQKEQEPMQKPYEREDTIDLKPPAIIPQFTQESSKPGKPFARPNINNRPEIRPMHYPRPEVATHLPGKIEGRPDNVKYPSDRFEGSKPFSNQTFNHQTKPDQVRPDEFVRDQDSVNWNTGIRIPENRPKPTQQSKPNKHETQTGKYDMNREDMKNSTMNNEGSFGRPSVGMVNLGFEANRPNIEQSTTVRIHPEYPQILTKPKPSVPGSITISSGSQPDKHVRPNIQFSMPVEAMGEEIDSKTQTERPPSMLVTKDHSNKNDESLETAYQTNFASSDAQNTDSKIHESKTNIRPMDQSNQDMLGSVESMNIPSRDMMPPPLRPSIGQNQSKKDEEGLKPPPPPSRDVVGLSPPPVDITTTNRPTDNRFVLGIANEPGLKPPPKYIPLKESTVAPLPSVTMIPPSPRPSHTRPFLVELLSQDMVPPPPEVKTTRPLEIATVRPAVAVSGSIQIATAVATSHIPVVQDIESKIPIIHGTVDLPIVVDVPDILRPVETRMTEHVSIYTVRPFDTRPVSRIQPTMTQSTNLVMPTKLRTPQVDHVQPSRSSTTNRDVEPTKSHTFEIPRNPVKRPEHPIFLESSYDNGLPSTRVEPTESLTHVRSTTGKIELKPTMTKHDVTKTLTSHTTEFKKQSETDIRKIPSMITRVDSSITKVTNTMLENNLRNGTTIKPTKNIVGTVIHEVVRNGTSATMHTKPKEVTRFKTSTVTRTETSVLGSPPTTRTLLLTHTLTSTTIETVTETLLRPTSVISTVTSTILQPVVTRVPSSYENVIDNDSIFVVMSDRKPPVADAEEVEAEYGEEDVSRDEQDPAGNEIHRVLAGGTLGAPVVSIQPVINQCSPECKASKAEICAEVGSEMRCVCRPGFARMFPDRPCKPTYTYTLRVGLDRIGNEAVNYENTLNDTTSTAYRKVIGPTRDALDRTLMQSDLRDVYRGLRIAGFVPDPTKVEFHVQLSDNANETRLKEVLRKYLVGSNYSLGGTEVYASNNLELVDATDFNECSNEEGGPHHDCSPNAACFNLRGSYQCSCKEGWADLSENPAYPGRICSQAPLGCSSCNNKGHCVTNTHGQEVCECFPWHSGQRCQVNLKVLLIALVTTGAILLGLLVVCVGMACFRHPSRKRRTGDRRAMIPGTGGDTSSEGSVTDLAIPHHVPHVLPPPPQMIAPLPPSKRPARKISHKPRHPPRKATMVPASVPMNDEQRDRSLTVMIPRAKYRSAPQSPQNYKSGMTTFSTEEHKLINYLENGTQNAGNRRQSVSSLKDCKEAELPVVRATTTPTGALVSAGFQVSATVTRTMDAESTLARSCGETTVEAATKVLTSGDLQGDLGSTLARSCGETTIQAPTKLLRLDLGEAGSTLARSCGETTIQPPTKVAGIRRNSVKDSRDNRDTRDSASEGHTMAERDLGSTLRLPAQHPPLYSPDRTSDRESNFDSL